MGERLRRDLTTIFHEADRDHSGTLSGLEFKRLLEDVNIQRYLATMGLEVSEAQGLFRLLDIDDQDDVTIDDFVWGSLRLKGHAKSIDLCTLLYEHRKHKQSVDKSLANIEKMLKTMGASERAVSSSTKS